MIVEVFPDGEVPEVARPVARVRVAVVVARDRHPHGLYPRAVSTTPSRPPWSAVSTSLARFDPTLTEARVRELHRERATSREKRKKADKTLAVGLTAALRELAGPWYGYGPWNVSNGVIVRESPQRFVRLEPAPRRRTLDERIADDTRLTLEAIERLMGLLRAFVPHAREDSRDGAPLDRAVSLTRAIDGVFDAAIVRSAGTFGWARYAADGIAWVLEARELATPERLAMLAALEQPDSLSNADLISPHRRFEFARTIAAAVFELDPAALRGALGTPFRLKLLAPERARLQEAREAVKDVKDPRVAWDTLVARGLIPLAFADDPTRSYHSGNRGIFSTPPTVAACVAVASDIPGIRRAEAIAGELNARLRPWGVKPCEQIVWHFTSRETVQSRTQGAPAGLRDVLEILAQVVEPAWAPNGTRYSIEEHVRDLIAWEVAPPGTSTRTWAALEEARAEVARTLQPLHTGGTLWSFDLLWKAAVSWPLLAQAGCTVPGRVFPGAWALYPRARRPRSTDGTLARFADLPDPFVPLLALWETGYVVGPIGQTLTLLGTVPG